MLMKSLLLATCRILTTSDLLMGSMCPPFAWAKHVCPGKVISVSSVCYAIGICFILQSYFFIICHDTIGFIVVRKYHNYSCNFPCLLLFVTLKIGEENHADIFLYDTWCYIVKIIKIILLREHSSLHTRPYSSADVIDLSSTTYPRLAVLFPVKPSVFWDVMIYSLVDIYKRFGRNFCLHLQDRRVFLMKSLFSSG
jgi:hypothetical protein